MTMEFIEEKSPARICVVGVGGCGGNIVRYLQARSVAGITYAAVNTDSQALSQMDGAQCVNIGESGLGAGAKPEVAAQAAEAKSDRLQELVSGCDMVFVAAGMGKGTGTGASPVIAKMAKAAGALTVAVATMPFAYERRDKKASAGLENLAAEVDSLLVVPNNKLYEVLGENVRLEDALSAANDVLYNAVCGISEIIAKPGEMNLDFNDVRSVMSVQGKAVMGSVCKSGAERARAAAEEALCCPIMEDVNLSAASHFLVNVTGSRDTLKQSELEIVHEVVDDNAPDCESERFSGIVYDDDMGDEIRVTIIATGIAEDQIVPALPEEKPTFSVMDNQVNDPCFVDGRQRQRQEKILQQNGGNEYKVPTIMRRQRN